MASVRNLKKNIDYVLGDIIEAVYMSEANIPAITTTGKLSPESEALIEEALTCCDTLITKVNAKNVENKRAHFKEINNELEQAVNQLVVRINAL